MDAYLTSRPTSTPAQVRKIVSGMLEGMMAEFREMPLRSFAYTVQLVLQQLYRGIHISTKDLERLREAAKKAHAEGISLVLLPTHKSHMYAEFLHSHLSSDYLVVSYVFFLCNIFDIISPL